MNCSKIILSLSIFLVLLACQKESNSFIVNKQAGTIEEIVNVQLIDAVNDVEIPVTTAYIKEKWESNFNDEFSLKTVAFNSFEIMKTDEEETGKTVYFLKAISDDRTIETGVFLKKINDEHYSLK